MARLATAAGALAFALGAPAAPGDEAPLFKVLVGNVQTVDGFHEIKIPYLGDIPILGQIFFNHSLPVYAAFLLVPVAWWFLDKTTWGLKIKSVGQNPAAADSLGVNVNAVRYFSVCVGAMLAGIAGPGKRWPFLYDKGAAGARLAAAAGVRFARLGKNNFAHPSVILLLTPDGKVARYLYGIEPRPTDLKLALMEAAGGKIDVFWALTDLGTQERLIMGREAMDRDDTSPPGGGQKEGPQANSKRLQGPPTVDAEERPEKCTTCGSGEGHLGVAENGQRAEHDGEPSPFPSALLKHSIHEITCQQGEQNTESTRQAAPHDLPGEVARHERINHGCGRGARAILQQGLGEQEERRDRGQVHQGRQPLQDIQLTNPKQIENGPSI